MANKRNPQATREEHRQSWPAWVWLGLGVLLGLTLSAIMLIKDWVPQLHKKNLPQPNPEASAPKESEQAVADEAGKKPTPPKNSTQADAVRSATSDAKSFAIAASLTKGWPESFKRAAL